MKLEIYHLEQYWDPVLKIWINQFETEKNYDSSGKLLFRRHRYHWDSVNKVFFNYLEEENHYNEDGLLITYNFDRIINFSPDRPRVDSYKENYAYDCDQRLLQVGTQSSNPVNNLNFPYSTTTSILINPFVKIS